MGKLENIFNIYCDESRVENSDSTKMVIGSLLIPRREKSVIIKDLKHLYQKNKFCYELKWTKTGSLFIQLYKDIIDYFINNSFMQFRCIVVDKTKVKYQEYHNNDRELAFFKFYFFLLRAKLLSQNKYYIFLDKKPTRDRNRARALHSYLESYIFWNKKNCSIKHLQAYDSKENILLQLTDYLTGLVGSAVNSRDAKGTKKEIVLFLREKLKIRSFDVSSSVGAEKFNIFVWKGIDEKNSGTDIT